MEVVGHTAAAGNVAPTADVVVRLAPVVDTAAQVEAGAEDTAAQAGAGMAVRTVEDIVARPAEVAGGAAPLVANIVEPPPAPHTNVDRGWAKFAGPSAEDTASAELVQDTQRRRMVVVEGSWDTAQQPRKDPGVVEYIRILETVSDVATRRPLTYGPPESRERYAEFRTASSHEGNWHSYARAQLRYISLNLDPIIKRCPPF